MGSSRSIVPARTRALTLLFLLAGSWAGGCTLAPAKVWNLEQLHEPDGSPRRRGNLKNDLEYLATEFLGNSGFGGGNSGRDERGHERPPDQQKSSAEKRIKDPLGECLENLVALADSKRDERVAALQVSVYAWLAVDCTYVLSRERSALELGALARALGLAEAGAPPAGEPSAPAAVKAHFDELLEAVRGLAAAPGLGNGALAAVCTRIGALPLDRPGALRLLRATSELLTDDERTPAYAPLRALRLELARRATALALRAALADPNGLVRAAALESALIAFPEERDAQLRWAVTEAMDGIEAREAVSLRALALLARHGLPAVSGELPAGERVQEWRAILLQVLRLSIDGPHDAAACKALAKLTGEPLTLRPEIWFERARATPGALPSP